MKFAQCHDDEGFHIACLGLYVAVVIGIGGGSLTLGGKALCLLAERSAQFGYGVAVIIVLPELPPSFHFVGVLVVGFVAVPDEYALADGAYLVYVHAAAGHDVVLALLP